MHLLKDNGTSGHFKEITRRFVSGGIGVALALATGWAVTRPFRAHINWMNFEQDDFFYYLKVAQNVALGHGSTFNGLVPTNGYHPLWMWTIAAVIRIGSGVRLIPGFLAISIWVATMTTYILGRRLLVRGGVRSLTAAALAAYAAVYAMHVFCYGMEVILTVPLMTGLLLLLDIDTSWSVRGWQAGRRGIAIGLIVTAMVLSRIDTIIFAGLIALGILVQPQLRRLMRLPLIAGIGLGLLPLMIYFIGNKIVFQTWLPISGMAKQLKIDSGFTSLAWMSLLGKSPLQLLNITPVVLALLVLPWLWWRLRPAQKAFVPATLAFPFIYLSILSWVSDWQLWGWYFYMLRPALLVAFLVLLETPQLRRLLAWTPPLALLVLITLSRILSVQWNEQQPEIIDAAEALYHFSITHPGVYAMGDRSGAVGYLLQQPMIQTEGLMMDREYLTLISNQLPLRTVLARYGVRYYVASSLKPYAGCFDAKEPAQAGSHAPVLRDEFCEPPIAEWKFAGWETMVFDLHK